MSGAQRPPRYDDPLLTSRPRAPGFVDPPGYARHRPETTLLYQLVEQHYPPFRVMRAEVDRPLPDFVEEEFEAYLKCGRLEEGFLCLRCEHCHAEKLVALLPVAQVPVANHRWLPSPDAQGCAR